MKLVYANIIIDKVLESLIDSEKLTQEKATFIKRVYEDLVYDKKIQKTTIEHFERLYPEMFEEGF